MTERPGGPSRFDYVADVNQDGVVNGFDVDPFVALVLGSGDGSGGAPVPEPMTLVLMVGGIGLARWRRG